MIASSFRTGCAALSAGGGDTDGQFTADQQQCTGCVRPAL